MMSANLCLPHSSRQIHGAHIQAGVSTASMGKFDRRLVGEKEGERLPAGKRRKFMDVTDTQTERKQLSGLADRFLRERCVMRGGKNGPKFTHITGIGAGCSGDG